MTNPSPSPHFGLVLDCADPHRLAEFWAEALGYANVGAAGVYVALYPREGNEVCIRDNGKPSTDMTS